MAEVQISHNIKEIKPGTGYKFIRIGDVFMYSDGGFHADMARKVPNIQYKKVGIVAKPVISDGGVVAIIDGKFSFFNTTSGCEIEGDKEIARQVTNQKAREILGVETLD